MKQSVCPKCELVWPVPCEQSVCISLFHECIVCRFGKDGAGTKDEIETVARLAAAAMAKEEV